MALLHYNKKGEFVFINDNEPNIIVTTDKDTSVINKQRLVNDILDALKGNNKNQNAYIWNMIPGKDYR